MINIELDLSSPFLLLGDAVFDALCNFKYDEILYAPFKELICVTKVKLQIGKTIKGLALLHPMVVVKKPDGRIRITIDYTKLNKFVGQPLHPMRTPKDAIDAVRPGDMYFTTMDATQGYWQMELCKESRHLTTFMSPEGRFLFKRCPMGLNATGDEFNRRGDLALEGLHNIEKVVDDILIHNESLESHIKSVIEVLKRCRQFGITLSRKKFNFCKSEVKYAGYEVGALGVCADRDKIKAIIEFPEPRTLAELRGFFDQLTAFTKDLAEVATDLRPLLKKKNMFVWEEVHQRAFDAVKQVLASPPILVPYDPSKEATLLTDASRKGLGFALLQEDRLILCGSRFVTEAESRYAMVELELLAIVWACHKCRLYLLGQNNFLVLTDHRPLIPILNDKRWDEIDNPRILRLIEKLAAFRFKADWRKGKEHAIPDALSRAPVSKNDEEDRMLEEELTSQMAVKVNYTAAILRDPAVINNENDPVIQAVEKEAEGDEEYNELREVVLGRKSATEVIGSLARHCKKFLAELSAEGSLVMYSSRIIVPSKARRDILHRLHFSNQGIEKTKKTGQRDCILARYDK